MKLALVLGNQLHRNHPAIDDDSVDAFLMIEAQNICNKLPYHKHKLILILSGMRHFAKYLTEKDKKVIYHKLEDTPDFSKALKSVFKEHSVDSIVLMQPAEIKTRKYFKRIFIQLGINYDNYSSQLFITPEEELDSWLEKNPKAIMETFYHWQRKRTGILMDGSNPIGRQWNFDKENRKPLPKKYEPVPKLLKIEIDEITKNVIDVVNKYFSKNVGDSDSYWLPTTYREADIWLDDFIKNRLSNFGTYEDAMHKDDAFLYHSVLSPLINCGLISAESCVAKAVKAFNESSAPLHSIEGFIRQIIGWREYMYCVYKKMDNFNNLNYFGFNKELEGWWFEANHENQNQLPTPVRIVLSRAHGFGYNHHIERLMVLGNWFLLNGYKPTSVYRWFSAMYVDAYEWVMVPNVIGMSQYADGGRVATKPYISGGNYLKKMGQWGDMPKEDLDKFTQLYWAFITNNYDKLKTNNRMQIILSQVNKK